MATRVERIAEAKQLLRDDPNITKRVMQARLVDKFGMGLADSTRRGLLQKANTPAVLRAKLRNRDAFTTHDALVLRKVLHRTGSTPYLVTAINDRYTRGRELWGQGKTRVQIRREVRESGYVAAKTTRTASKPDGTVRGQVDWWKLLRDYRDRAIDRGDYIPKPRTRPRTSRGDVRAQRARYQDKQSTKAHERWVERERSRLQTWITQKDRAISVSTGERRAQLQKERQNLAATLRGIR